MNIMFAFTDIRRHEKHYIVNWREYNSPFLPGVGDKVWLKVIKSEEENSEKRKYCKVVERSFYQDGDVYMEVLWED